MPGGRLSTADPPFVLYVEKSAPPDGSLDGAAEVVDGVKLEASDSGRRAARGL